MDTAPMSTLVRSCLTRHKLGLARELVAAAAVLLGLGLGARAAVESLAAMESQPVAAHVDNIVNSADTSDGDDDGITTYVIHEHAPQHAARDCRKHETLARNDKPCL